MIDMTGDMIINVPGTVVENIRLAGSITVTASEVTIRNVEVNATGAYGISGDGIDDLVVLNVRVTGTGGANGVVVFNGGLVKLSDISGFENGIRFGGDGVVIQQNYIHGLTSGAPGALIDGIQTTGASGALISHNTIDNAGQSNVLLKTDYGPITSVRVTDNQMLGTPGRNVIVTIGAGSAVITAIEIDHNGGQRGSVGDFAVDTAIASQVSIHDNTLSGADPILGSRIVTAAQTTRKPTQTSSVEVVGAVFIPTADNVGYLVSMGTLTNSTGTINTSANGQIIELKHMLAGHYINVSHNNVIIRKCVSNAGDYYPIRIIHPATGTIIEDTTVDSGYIGILCSACTIRRCKIINTENGIATDGGNVTIQMSYISQMLPESPGDRHPDCIQIDGSYNNILIEYNTIINDQGSTAAVMIDNYEGAIDNVIVRNNHLGGGSYPLYVDSHFGADNITNVQILNNVFVEEGGYGYAVVTPQTANNVTWSGNVDDVGATVPMP